MLCFGLAAHLVLQQDKQLATWIRLVLTGTKHNSIRQSEVLAGFRNWMFPIDLNTSTKPLKSPKHKSKSVTIAVYNVFVLPGVRIVNMSS